ncbi:uncharacterized protein LOC123552537 isoform X2 [Mercenaria mercenaria]|uniref:uncharacterized protein LOC123552537 isoform X2 n=1 Tax=Mercenaria mercenaria TaxID=6596 RepID=UPI00234E7A8A|nr:uncharacterized protein LOC123552537 isoform X2 [Mercenaria mercenaria]
MLYNNFQFTSYCTEQKRNMQSEGIGLLGRSQSVQETCCGPRIVWQGLTKKERRLFIFFITVTILCLTAAVAISIIRMTQLDHNSAKFTFCIVIVINAVSCMVFAILGPIFQRSSDFMIIIPAFGTGFIIAIIDGVDNWNKDSSFTKTSIILFCTSSVIAILVAIFKLVRYMMCNRMAMVSAGTSPHAQKLHVYKNSFRSVLLYDVQISFSVMALLWPEGPHFDLGDRIVILPAAAASIIMCIIGYIIVKIDERPKCYICLWFMYGVLWLGNLGFGLFMITEASLDMRNRGKTLAQDGIYIVALVICSVSIILRIVTAALCYKLLVGWKRRDTIQSDDVIL